MLKTKSTNYLTWIANLGVVPLLRFAAFLLAPAFLLFRALLFSVIFVRDAMRSLPEGKFKKVNLALLALQVNFLPTALSSVYHPPLSQSPNSDIILAKGEQKEIKLTKLTHFSVGNPQVISYRYEPKTGVLLIKAKKVGFSDLVVWNKKQKTIFKIYILTHQKFLKTHQLAESLKNLNLELNIQGSLIAIKGEINQIDHYLYLHKLQKLYPHEFFNQVKLSVELKRELIGKIYLKLLNREVSHLSCNVIYIEIRCIYQGNSKSNTILKHFQSQYYIKFTQEISDEKLKNYHLKVKIIQLERLDGLEIHTGLDQINTQMSSALHFGIKSLIENNQIFLQENKLSLSTLTESEIILNLDQNQLIEIGSHIPFQSMLTQNGVTTGQLDWRFAGLRIKTKLRQVHSKLILDFETEFSRPLEQGISSSKESSSAYVKNNQYQRIFKIGYQTSSKNRKGIPLLNKIPILKNLFESKSNQDNYKEIYGYLVIEEQSNG